MTAQAQRSRTTGARRIIERPRLIKLLDDAQERTILLVAPAGYGKTTLARQWARTLNRSIWITLTAAHRDVVNLAEDLASGIDRVGGTAREYISEYLSGQRNPQRAARDVGIALASLLDESRVQWLILDDYHELTANPEHEEHEEVVRLIHERSNVRLLIATRSRPNWATPRAVMYGEIFEIGMDLLAMTPGESRRLLSEPRFQSLLNRAQGWPAVLGLARGIQEDVEIESNVLPGTLHDYLAGELYHSAGPEFQQHLISLALLPGTSIELITTEFGAMAPEVIERARSLGFLAGESETDLHPLLREFLLAKLRDTPDGNQRAQNAIIHCIELGEWDQALMLARTFHLREMFRPILESAYKPLLRSGRIGTLGLLGEALRAVPAPHPVEADLVDAEVGLCDGEYRLALQISRRIRNQLTAEHPLRARAAAIEGAAAFQLADFDQSERAYEAALGESVDDLDRAEAQHGLVLAAVYGERPTADKRIEDLSRRAEQSGSALDVARHAASVLARMRIGPGFSDDAYIDDALRVVPYVENPGARSSVMVTIAYCLGLQARYSEAHDLTRKMLEEAKSYGLEFALPHGEWNMAFSLIGLREFTDADRALQRIEDRLEHRHLAHHLLNARVLRARLLMQLSRYGDAYELVRHPVNDGAAPSMHAEYVAMRALALALIGKKRAAVEQAKIAEAMSVACDVRLFVAGVRAILAAEEGDIAGATAIVPLARRTKVWDPVTFCARSSKALAAALAETPDCRTELGWLYGRSNDFGLARRARLRQRNTRHPKDILSRRELEVLDLMSQGLRNGDIAVALVVSASTIKAHVRHILEKLGVHSRTEAVMRYRSLNG